MAAAMLLSHRGNKATQITPSLDDGRDLKWRGKTYTLYQSVRVQDAVPPHIIDIYEQAGGSTITGDKVFTHALPSPVNEHLLFGDIVLAMRNAEKQRVPLSVDTLSGMYQNMRFVLSTKKRRCDSVANEGAEEEEDEDEEEEDGASELDDDEDRNDDGVPDDEKDEEEEEESDPSSESESESSLLDDDEDADTYIPEDVSDDV
jgi:hypothetical protein